MTKVIYRPLAIEDRMLLRRVVLMRCILLICMILPLLTFSVYINSLALLSFVDGDEDVYSFIVPSISVLLYVLGFRYIFPFYRNIFTYRRQTEKEVVTTPVVEVVQQYSSLTGIRFLVKTNCLVIDTNSDIILQNEVAFLSIQEGMVLEIHRIPSAKNEYLRIKLP